MHIGVLMDESDKETLRTFMDKGISESQIMQYFMDKGYSAQEIAREISNIKKGKKKTHVDEDILSKQFGASIRRDVEQGRAVATTVEKKMKKQEKTVEKALFLAFAVLLLLILLAGLYMLINK